MGSVDNTEKQTPGTLPKVLPVKPCEPNNTLSSATKQALQDAMENCTLRTDTHRELRAMLLSVHPCPPLPMLANNAESHEIRVFSSHDFLATAIDRMLLNPDIMRDTERRDSQLALCEMLAKGFASINADGSLSRTSRIDAIYDKLTSFSRNYAALYFDKEHRQSLDIRFTSWYDVCRKDAVHMAACAHLRAFNIMRNIEPSSPTEFEDLSYGDVLVKFCRSLVDSQGVLFT